MRVMLMILMISDWDADGGNSDCDTGGDNGDGIEDDVEAVSHFCLIIISSCWCINAVG